MRKRKKNNGLPLIEADVSELLVTMDVAGNSLAVKTMSFYLGEMRVLGEGKCKAGFTCGPTDPQFVTFRGTDGISFYVSQWRSEVAMSPVPGDSLSLDYRLQFNRVPVMDKWVLAQ